MKKDELYSTILGCSVSGFYKWKKQNRLIISLLEKYFTKEDLEEFLERGEINRFESIEDLKKEQEELIENLKKVLKGLT